MDGQEQAPLLLAAGGGGEIKEPQSSLLVSSNVVVLQQDDVRPSVNQQLFIQLQQPSPYHHHHHHHAHHGAAATDSGALPPAASNAQPSSLLATPIAGHTPPVMASLQPLSIPPTPAYHSTSPTPSLVGASHVAISVNTTPPSTSDGPGGNDGNGTGGAAGGPGYTELQSPSGGNKQPLKINSPSDAKIAFDKLDRKRDGRLGEDDIGAALVAVGCTVPTSMVKAFVRAFDLRAMGGIHYDEFLKVRSVINQRPLEDKKEGGIDGSNVTSIARNDSDDMKSERWRFGMDERLSDQLITKRRAPWRQALGRFLEHQYTVRFIVFILLCDIIRFFLYLLIVEDVMGSGQAVSDMRDDLKWISIAVLSFFSLELLLLFIAFDFSVFRHSGYIIDWICVPVALGLEVGLGKFGGFIVIGRSWRILQVLQAYDVNQDTMRMKHEAFAIAVAKVEVLFNYLKDMLIIKKAAVSAQRADVSQLKTGARHTTPTKATELKAGEKPTEPDGLDSSETTRILSILDHNKDGRVTYDDLKQALLIGGISVSDEQSRSIIGAVSQTGIIGRHELGKLRDIFNARFKAIDPLMDPTLFYASMEKLRRDVQGVLYQTNEDPTLDENYLQPPELEPYMPYWRRVIANFVNSKGMTIAIAVLLVLDVIRFFLDLLNLEKTFGGDDVTDDADNALNIIAIVILSLFLTEVAIRLLALQELFFRSWGNIGDLIIVPISLAIEVSYHGIGGFLVFLRLWRLFRVMRTVANASEDRVRRREQRGESQLQNYQTNFARLADTIVETHQELLAVESEAARLKIQAGIIPATDAVFLAGSPRSPEM